MSVDGEVVGAIGTGLLVLLGVGRGDDEAQAAQLADKVARLRVFDGRAGAHGPLAARPRRRGALHQPVHALRRHAPGPAAELHGGCRAGAGRAPLRPVLRAAGGPRRAGRDAAASAPGCRSRSSTRAPSRCCWRPETSAFSARRSAAMSGLRAAILGRSLTVQETCGASRTFEVGLRPLFLRHDTYDRSLAISDQTTQRTTAPASDAGLQARVEARLAARRAGRRGAGRRAGRRRGARRRCGSSWTAPAGSTSASARGSRTICATCCATTRSRSPRPGPSGR